jgi:integrase/recombinase XerD
MPRQVIGVVDLAQCSSNSDSQPHNNTRTIHTFFHNGVIVELPTRWVRSISFEPRYSPLTVNQYAHNLKDFVAWLCESERYRSLALDDALIVVNRRDLQNWIADRKAARLENSTLRNREVAVKLFLEWLTTAEAGQLRSEGDTAYKTGQLISPAAEKRKPRFISFEVIVGLLNAYHNEGERCLVHTLYDTGLRISEVQRLQAHELPKASLHARGQKYYPLHVRGSKGPGGRTKDRIALISAPVLARISRYHNSPEYRFSPFWQQVDPHKPAFLQVNGNSISPRNLRSQMDLAAFRAGLDPALFCPHNLRHGAAFSLLRSELGKDYFDKLFLVQQLFGHKSITTTEIYTVIPPAVLAKLNANNVIVEKYEEAKKILDATYLPPAKHNEARGHRRN